MSSVPAPRSALRSPLKLAFILPPGISAPRGAPAGAGHRPEPAVRASRAVMRVEKSTRPVTAGLPSADRSPDSGRPVGRARSCAAQRDAVDPMSPSALASSQRSEASFSSRPPMVRAAGSATASSAGSAGVLCSAPSSPPARSSQLLAVAVEFQAQFQAIRADRVDFDAAAEDQRHQFDLDLGAVEAGEGFGTEAPRRCS